MSLSPDTQSKNLVQSGLVGAVAVGIDKTVYNNPFNDPLTIFGMSAASEFFSENVDEILFASSMPGQSQITGPVSSGLVYLAANMALKKDQKSPLYCFLQQVGASATGRYLSPMIRGSY